MRITRLSAKLSITLYVCTQLGCGLIGTTTQKSIPETPRIDTAYDVAEGTCKTIWQSTGIMLHETPEHDWGVQCVFDTHGSANACRMIGGYEFRGVNPYDGTPGYRLCGVDVAYDDTCTYERTGELANC